MTKLVLTFIIWVLCSSMCVHACEHRWIFNAKIVELEGTLKSLAPIPYSTQGGPETQRDDVTYPKRQLKVKPWIPSPLLFLSFLSVVLYCLPHPNQSFLLPHTPVQRGQASFLKLRGASIRVPGLYTDSSACSFLEQNPTRPSERAERPMLLIWLFLLPALLILKRKLGLIESRVLHFSVRSVLCQLYNLGQITSMLWVSVSSSVKEQ